MLIVLLYEPMVNVNAKFNCLAANKIAAFSYTNSVCPSVRDKSEHCENGER